MKKKMKLINLTNDKLLNTKGGADKDYSTWECSCSCAYSDDGGSSSLDNASANGLLKKGGGRSKTGDNRYKITVYDYLS